MIDWQNVNRASKTLNKNPMLIHNFIKQVFNFQSSVKKSYEKTMKKRKRCFILAETDNWTFLYRDYTKKAKLSRSAVTVPDLYAEKVIWHVIMRS